MASRKKVLLKVLRLPGIEATTTDVLSGHHPWRQWGRKDELDEPICMGPLLPVSLAPFAY